MANHGWELSRSKVFQTRLGKGLASIEGSEEYAGESAKVVQQLLRHSSQQVTTEIYTHLFPEDLDRLRDGLDRICGEAVADTKFGDRKRAREDETVVSMSTRRKNRARDEARADLASGH
ncbi:MAG: hypothetical protein ACRDKF_07300 [Actinomycetota bacterium]